MELVDLFNYAGVFLLALFAFGAGRMAERRYWVSKAQKESDYKWLI